MAVALRDLGASVIVHIGDAEIALADDSDAGRMLDGEALDDVADELFELIRRTASGEPARDERNGERGIALWKTGVTL